MNKFLEKYKITDKQENQIIDRETFIETINFPFVYDIINELGGISFNKGLFRIHTFEYVFKWTKLLKDYFKEEISDFDLVCFASNWQGNMYCVNALNSKIIYFDPATVEFFEAEFSIEDFFNEVLVDDEYDIIFEDYFVEAKNIKKFDFIDYDKSIGHIIYLHLGGEDQVSNLEIVDTEVLWSLQIEVANRINEIKK